jgi:hypothetical protein
MSTNLIVGTFDDFRDAWAAMDKHDHEYGFTDTAPYVVTARRASDAEERCWDAECIGHQACEAFGPRFQCMPHRLQFRAEAMAKIAASTSLEERPGTMILREARRAAVETVNSRGRRHFGGPDRARLQLGEARTALLPSCAVRGRDLQRQLYVDTGRLVSGTFCVEILADGADAPARELARILGLKPLCGWTSLKGATAFSITLYQRSTPPKRLVMFIIEQPRVSGPQGRTLRVAVRSHSLRTIPPSASRPRAQSRASRNKAAGNSHWLRLRRAPGLRSN